MTDLQQPLVAELPSQKIGRNTPVTVPRKLFERLIPIAIGLIAFYLIVGPRVLDPTNIAWLVNGDPSQHYLGWGFFRNSPWSFPIGLNPAYGMELGSAIIFSDSNPLLAILFKPLSPFLPNTFQYFGMWLLACFVLQAWFSWKLVGLVASDSVIRGLMTSLFVCSPPMLWRLFGHLSLTGHFLVLAALYCLFKPGVEHKNRTWNLILVVSALVHGYLLAMISPLWIGDLADRLRTGTSNCKKIFLEFAVGTTLLALTCWQAGYFSVGKGVSASGYGFNRANLLAMFDSSGWSYILKDIPEGQADAGSNYLRLGFILLLIWSIPTLTGTAFAIRRRLARFGFRLAALLACALFAFSQNVSLGPHVFAYPLPDPVLGAFNIFRASGRFFWPVFYSVCFAICYLFVKRYSRRVAIPMLAVAALAQFLDTSAVWLSIRGSLMAQPSSEWQTELRSAFWIDAANRYKKVRWIRPQVLAPYWKTLSYYAQSHNLASDSVALARIDERALEALRLKADATISSGKFEADTLYVLDDKSFRLALSHADQRIDGFFRIDGFNVVAPGWRKCSSCPQAIPDAELKGLLLELVPGQQISFKDGGAGVQALDGGWSVPEPWGVWSDGDRAALAFRNNRPISKIVLDTQPFLTPTHSRQRVRVTINGMKQESLVELTPVASKSIELNLNNETQKKLRGQDVLKVEFTFLDAIEPKNAGYPEGTRRLGLGLLSMTAY